MKVQDALAQLRGVRKNRSGWTARCPAHDDNRNSLSVSEGHDGKILFKCHRGCSYPSILAALSLNTGASNGRQIAAIYNYYDESGALLYQSVRYEPKDFRQRRPNGSGGYIWDLNGARRVLYRLPELLLSDKQEIVFIVEGEKDADRLASLGLTATTNVSGALKWLAEYSELLRERLICILPDNDETGVKHAEIVAHSIHGIAANVKIVSLPDLPPKGDVSDYLDTGGTRDELLCIVEQAAEWQPSRADAAPNDSSDTPALRIVRMSDVQTRQVEWLWFPYIARGKLTILEGEEGIGKSQMTCALACAISHGRGLPNSESFEAGNVLMLSAEDGLADTVRPRLDILGADTTRIFAVAERLTLDRLGMLRLESAIIEYTPALVIIDPLFAYTGARVDIHRSNELREVSTPLAEIAERHRCALLVLRHIGKSRGDGDPRRAGLGGIDLRAAARSVLLVGTDPDDKCRCAVVQTKNNLAPLGESIGYTLERGAFLWTGASDLTAQRILSAVTSEDERGCVAEAMDFLRSALVSGARPAKEIKAEAAQTGLTEQNLRTARARLSVKVSKEGGRLGDKQQRWMWQLPKVEDVGIADSDAEDVKQNDNQHLLSNDSSKAACNNDLLEDVNFNSSNIFCAPEVTTSPLTD